MATPAGLAVDTGKSGTACIKSEYLFHSETVEERSENNEPYEKRQKLEDNRKKARGQNKGRYQKNKSNIIDNKQLCRSVINVREGEAFPTCTFSNCKFVHNVKEYMNSKEPDLGNECYVFKTKGLCPRGVTCRFGSAHIDEDGKNKVVGDVSKDDLSNHVILPKDLQIQLRKKKYNFEKADKIADEAWAEVKNQKKKENGTPEADTEPETGADIENKPKEGCCITNGANSREKKKIDWKGKLYLAPLTTLGNLPFRRICKEWGADITCGEMAMAIPILQGVAHEWTLLRRHESEKIFGVQICGNNPHVLTRCAQLIEETTDVDFIDLNLGCPIELVYKQGGGSGLLRQERMLTAVVKSLSRITTLPLTVKTRTGLYDDKRVALSHIPLYTSADVSMITVHGRTREQRYCRSADWEYIEECATKAAPTPVFGNGDILSYQHYNDVMSKYPHVAGVMIGRGALYKPWIFTEIKEQRDWDISSTERLDILKKFVNYGFEHWGSDTQGIEKTRRFLLEWLSFLHRYIPVGLLERPPQSMNERPPRYVGRNDLETLMASANSADWVKISEMICGPVPEGFTFLPKHKANAWTTE